MIGRGAGIDIKAHSSEYQKDFFCRCRICLEITSHVRMVHMNRAQFIVF